MIGLSLKTIFYALSLILLMTMALFETARFELITISNVSQAIVLMPFAVWAIWMVHDLLFDSLTNFVSDLVRETADQHHSALEVPPTLVWKRGLDFKISQLANQYLTHYNSYMKMLNKSFSSVFPKQMRSAGMSLIEVMVVAGVFGVVIVSINNMMLNSMSTLKMMEQKNEVLDLRRIIKLRIDCAKTKAATNNWATCSGGNRVSDSRISGRDANDAEVISPNGTNYGDYTIKMTCSKANNVNLVVSVATTQKVVETDLFQKVPLTCQL